MIFKRIPDLQPARSPARVPAPQFPNPAFREPGCRPAETGRHELGPHADCPRSLLSPPRVPRVGKAKAITATARKLAILAYRTLKGTLVYQDPGAADTRQRVCVLRGLRQRGENLGFALVNRATGELLEGVVS